ncbi:MAG: DUF5131 family protein, partial [Rhizobiales bacterium]|nr:DUF5131 family protein [Hyphomicrobiales bacterium]
ALAPQHTFQVLTKRSARMRKYLSAARAHPVGMEALEITLFEHLADPKSKVGSGCMMKGDFPHLATWPLPNVWLGISAERQQEAAERIPDLLATPAAVRFVSAEPLLGPLDFRCLTVGGDGELDALSALSWQQIWDNQWSPEVTGVPHDEAIEGFLDWYNLPVMPTGLAHPSLDWIIVGGESGNGARPMHPDWARSIRNQCAAAGVPFFFKQWGEFGPAFGVDLLPTGQPWSGDDQRAVARGVATLEQATRWMGKRRAGRFLDGVEHNAMPAPREVPFS